MNYDEENALLTELVILVGKGDSDEAVDLLADKVFHAGNSVEQVVLDLSTMVIHLANALSRAANDIVAETPAPSTTN